MARRKRAEDTVSEMNRALEQRVAERTEQLERTNADLAHEIRVRKHAEEELRLAASVYEDSPEGIVISDADCRILQVNRALTEIMGYAAEEVIGQKLDLHLSGQHDDSFYENL